MTTTFNRTRTQIAQRVLGKVIKIGAATAASADYDLVYEAIDLRLKEFHKLGIFWRKVTAVPVTFSLTAAVATASVSFVSAGAEDILFPIHLTWTNGTSDDYVHIIGKHEYAELHDSTTSGNPAVAMWKGGAEFVFYPVPTANGTAKLLYQKIVDDTSAGANIDIDVSMIRPMMDIIKYDVADDYGIPETTQARWMRECEKAERDIRKLAVQRVEITRIEVDDYDGRRRDYSDA